MGTDRFPVHRAAPALGVLLINLGTPTAPEPGAIRRYLREFLSDRRVVELPALLWWPVLYGFILPFRPRRLAHAYGSIWTPAGSPLLATTQALGAAVEVLLRKHLAPQVHVAVGMRYGRPSINSALDQLAAANARRIVVLPLYPQYAASSTGSALDGVWRALLRSRWVPEMRSLGSYHDDPGYIRALAASLRDWWQQHGRGDHLLLSFHGIPQKQVLAGDPYYCHCRKTARLLAAELQLADADWSIAFQSRLGRIPWIKPYTDEVLPQLAARGIRRLDVACPGFAADCLETLEEVAIRYRNTFAASGGELRYIPALNAGDGHAAMIAGIVGAAALDWVPPGVPAAEAERREAGVATLLADFGLTGPS